MMTRSKLPRDVINQDLVTVRALSSITSEQTETIARHVQASGLAWSVQTFDDYDGYLSILIMPSVGGDNQKSFFISGTIQRLELFESQDDNLAAIESFSDVEATSARLLELIAQH